MSGLSSDLLIASTLASIRNSNVDELTHRLNTVLRTYSPDAQVYWRNNIVMDFRGIDVPSGAERLSRWDDRHPDEIFVHGFQPHSDSVNDSDLWNYVLYNEESIFVWATRYRDVNGRPYRWQPRRNVRFEYEVLANGGIDINASLGNHQYYNQHEIVFPGGIRPEFIRTAREYDPENMRLIRVWANGGYDNGANGANIVHLVQLADPVIGPNTEVRYWTGDQDHHTRVPRDTKDELMHEPGEQKPDDLMMGDLSAKPTRATLTNPGNKNEAYIFADNQYVLIRIAPGTTNDVIVNGPKLITREWPALKQANFPRVDAAYPSPARRWARDILF